MRIVMIFMSFILIVATFIVPYIDHVKNNFIEGFRYFMYIRLFYLESYPNEQKEALILISQVEDRMSLCVNRLKISSECEEEVDTPPFQKVSP